MATTDTVTMVTTDTATMGTMDTATMDMVTTDTVTMRTTDTVEATTMERMENTEILDTGTERLVPAASKHVLLDTAFNNIKPRRNRLASSDDVCLDMTRKMSWSILPE